MGKSNLSKSDVERMKAEKNIEGLVKALMFEGDLEIRRDAARALGEIGDERTVAALTLAIIYGHSEVRGSAVEALIESYIGKLYF